MDKENASRGPVVVGRILSPHGVSGQFQVEVLSDSLGRFSAGGILYLNGEPRRVERSSDLPKNRLALKLEGIESRTEAESLRDSVLVVPEEMVLPPPEGEYYHFQIIDMRVYTRQQEYLGQITRIFSTGSNDVYVVSRDGRELLVPALHDVIVEVDVDGGTMTVELPEGLT